MLKLALDWAIVGDDESVALEHRPAIRATRQATDPDAILRGCVDVVSTVASRVAGLAAALAAAAADGARKLWEQAQEQRLHGARAFVDHLVANAGLRSVLGAVHPSTLTTARWVDS